MARELDEGNLEETLESSSRAESRAESERGFTGSGSEPYSDEPVRNQGRSIGYAPESSL